MNTSTRPTSTHTVYSLDDETFDLTSVASVLQTLSAAGKLAAGTVFYAAESQPIRTDALFDVPEILDLVDERAYEAVGEHYNNEFSTAGAPARRELAQLLAAWAERHVVPATWRQRGASRAVAVSAQDLLRHRLRMETACTEVAR